MNRAIKYRIYPTKLQEELLQKNVRMLQKNLEFNVNR